MRELGAADRSRAGREPEAPSAETAGDSRTRTGAQNRRRLSRLMWATLSKHLLARKPRPTGSNSNSNGNDQEIPSRANFSNGTETRNRILAGAEGSRSAKIAPGKPSGRERAVSARRPPSGRNSSGWRNWSRPASQYQPLKKDGSDGEGVLRRGARCLSAKATTKTPKRPTRSPRRCSTRSSSGAQQMQGVEAEYQWRTQMQEVIRREPQDC